MSKIKKIIIFTGNRAEYGLLSPVIKELCGELSWEVSLIISGSHLSEDFGKTIKEIDTSLIQKVKKINLTFCANEKRSKTLHAFSFLTEHSTEVLRELRPDLILLAGDRFETFAMAITAFYMNIPIAHLFGGDLSQGGHLDDSVRHSITKLSHLHFTTNKDSYKRVLGLGEEPWRVFNVGLPSLDNVIDGEYTSENDIAKEFNLDISKPIVLFTQHPVTTESELAYDQAKESLEALKELGYQTVVTYPCNDFGSEQIIKAISEYESNPAFRIEKSLGWKHYLGFLKIVSVVAGNSSSGLMETPIFKVPCVNIGTRQDGRLRAENVIDVPCKKDEIKEAIIRALNDKDFTEEVKSCSNPYTEGRASDKIVKALKSVSLDKKLLQKKMTF